MELCACDVAQDPEGLVQRLPLEALGVAHLAGVLHDGLFKHQDLDVLDRTMKPKVDGIALLMEIFKTRGSADRVEERPGRIQLLEAFRKAYVFLLSLL